MQFAQSLVALIASASLATAAPGFSFKRADSSCLTTNACPFEIMVAGCQASQLVDGQVRVSNSSISQITDGQARCDLTGSAPTNFTLSNGQVTDSSGRLCEISSQDQFQCSATPDAGASTTGFSVCNGLLSYNSNSSFIACLATGEYPGYNIYTANVDRSTVTDCMAVELDVPACAVSSSSCVASTTTATVVSTSVPAAVTVTSTPAAVTVTQTPAAVTVNNTVTSTKPAQTITDTITATASAVAQTVTNTVTASAVAQTVTNTVTATATATAVAQTVTNTVTASAVAQTVTSTVTATASAQTVTQVSTVTVFQTATQVKTDVEVQTATIEKTASATPVVATSTLAKATSSSAQATCTNITRALGSSNFPTTIEVVNENTSASGSSYFAYIGNGNSTIFTFNSVGSSGQCSLNFDFPTTAEIQAAAGTTSYEISSSSISVTLYELDSVAAITDTYATKPARGTGYSATLTPGSNSTFVTFACPSSQASYELVATDSNTLSFFEDYNLPVLGLTQASCE